MSTNPSMLSSGATGAAIVPAAGMTDSELLSALCGPQAVALLANKSLHEVFGLDADHTAVPGVAGVSECRGEYLAYPQLSVAKELLQRAFASQLRARDVLASPDAIKGYLRLRIGHLPYEVFGVLFLDAQMRLLADVEMFRGSVNATSVYPRQILRAALAHNACAVVLYHNHPSGDLTPSRADEALTQKIRMSLSHIDVDLMDHVIVGSCGARSMCESGLM
ncbi:JAB domain-containing protein [Curvibacter sp. APW13]|uniref:JAB domain-containing protein n=1 Tax=Curvibacter sp. APW13 TaxID=3077236 RepID=UPI0028DFCF34|nr:JAB domain-containing protein [Curvibacter sp. APW13]MDT8992695.1 JAB domain-containing protein [Curvibacter sp. APW13]